MGSCQFLDFQVSGRDVIDLKGMWIIPLFFGFTVGQLLGCWARVFSMLCFSTVTYQLLIMRTSLLFKAEHL